LQFCCRTLLRGVISCLIIQRIKMVIILYWITRLFYIYSSFAPLHLLVNAKYRIEYKSERKEVRFSNRILISDKPVLSPTNSLCKVTQFTWLESFAANYDLQRPSFDIWKREIHRHISGNLYNIILKNSWNPRDDETTLW